MRIVPASFEVLTKIDGEEMLRGLEEVARTCYQSEGNICEGSAAVLIQKLLDHDPPHDAMIEFDDIKVRFIVDRGITHEMVRHRIASFAQESTRWCNYLKGRFGGEITVIDLKEHCKTERGYRIWLEHQEACEAAYTAMLGAGETPQIARSCLSNSTKAMIVMKTNLRSWRNFFRLRAAKPAHPQMREVACPLLVELRKAIPIVFDDVGDPNA